MCVIEFLYHLRPLFYKSMFSHTQIRSARKHLVHFKRYCRIFAEVTKCVILQKQQNVQSFLVCIFVCTQIVTKKNRLHMQDCIHSIQLYSFIKLVENYNILLEILPGPAKMFLKILKFKRLI